MPDPNSQRQQLLRNATDVTIRVGTLILLVGWCFLVVSPFLLPIAWGVIIAIALHDPFEWLRLRLGGRAALAASIVTLLLLAVVLVPGVLIAGSFADDVESLARAFRAGQLQVPPPTDSVAGWPLIGPRLHHLWLAASQDLSKVLTDVGPRLQPVARWLLNLLAQFGVGMLQFIFASIISGVVMATSGDVRSGANALAARLGGGNGPELVNLARETVRGVTRGILGVALIQALLSGAALFLAGVPGAALWSVLTLICGVLQIGTGLIMFPAAIWLFSHASTTTAVLFLIWALVLAPLDNILKPILMGRGLRAPVLIVFVGAIGGFVTQGIIGLFVGAVVMVVGYELFKAWLADTDDTDTPLPPAA